MIRALILHVVCLPANALAMLGVLMLWPFAYGARERAAKRWRVERGALVMIIDTESPFGSRWSSLGAALGPHVVVCRDYAFPGIVPHELVHAEHHQAAAVFGCALGAGAAIAGAWPWALACAALTPLLVYAAGLLSTWLRGERAYLGHPQEEAARAIGGDGP